MSGAPRCHARAEKAFADEALHGLKPLPGSADIAFMPPSSRSLSGRELKGRQKQRERLVEGLTGFGAVGGLLLALQHGFDVAASTVCPKVSDAEGVSSCVEREVLAAAQAVAPTVILFALLGFAFAVAMCRAFLPLR